jgi:hypothetical protein
MAQRFVTPRTDADNSSGSVMPAARSDWRTVRRFHVGTGHPEPNNDAGYTTAGAFRAAITIDQSVVLGEESIYELLEITIPDLSMHAIAGFCTFP